MMKKIIIVWTFWALLKIVPHLHKRFMQRMRGWAFRPWNSKLYRDDNKCRRFKDIFKKIKENIDTLEEVIENIKYNFDGTKWIYKRYYNISLDIIKKFETFNKSMKNYRILRTLRNLTFSNKQMLDNLNKIINEKELQNKCSNIIETYLSKENLYKGKSFKNVKLEND